MSCGRIRPCRRAQRGFAMLFVLAMAAAAAFLFYRELPRIAFERQREREQLLIERGEQYRRAIQLYVRKFNRYPPEISALENTNNIRFLRRRYKDPMTGKAEWRLIHVGPGGVFLDSLLNKPADKDKLESKETAEAGGAETGQPTLPGLRRRASEMPGAFAGQAVPGAPSGEEPPAVPSPEPGAPAMAPPVQAYPVPQVGFAIVPVQPGQQGSPVPAAQVPAVPAPGGPLPTYPLIPIGQPAAGQPAQTPPPYPTQNVPGLPGPYGQPGVPSIGAITISPAAPPSGPTYSTQPGVGGAPAPGGASPFPQPGYQPAPAQNPALQMIRDILTKPRPGGLAGVLQQGAPGGGQVIGGGIAGVASTLEAEGIMVYNDRTKYNEWEFLYDIRKDPLKMGQLGLAAAGALSGPAKTMTQSPAGETPPSLYTPPSGSRRR